jgi:hypothetical protein
MLGVYDQFVHSYYFIGFSDEIEFNKNNFDREFC